MRKPNAQPTMGELMGEGFENKTKLTLDDLPKILGHAMPKIPFSRVGRVRLVHALQKRFGDGFRNMPGVDGILSHFDKECAAEQAALKIKRSRSDGN